ncbi:SOS response-associated peptidase [Pseudomonas massiliensis]|uniref:SOS response-associated peptidase n=1 Tax=Pseudomonas massiliensis TaxID=522492 RepID=UPI00058D14CE|nr:SOS response-associated peptidase family protein [Pseudomonas massiliensis]
MCGRFVQDRSLADYVDWLGSTATSGYDGVPLERYNVAPTATVNVFQGDGDGLLISSLKWGWLPFWAKGKRPPAINARVETVSSSGFFRDAWPNRLLVPAAGWYEWVKDPKDAKRKQPYFIRLRSGEPVFFAGIGRSDEGFVILTADSMGGMVDIHDRRPIVLAPDLAREWMDPATLPERAEAIVRNEGTGVEAFEWYPVDKAVGNVRNQGEQLVLPLDRGPEW